MKTYPDPSPVVRRALLLGAGLFGCTAVDEPPTRAAPQAIGGIEGTMEFALDVPWRIEPSVDRRGVVEYGAVPIQLSIHDADIIALDSPGRALGNVCQLRVFERSNLTTPTRTFRFEDLDEVEKSPRWRSPAVSGPLLGSGVCRPGGVAGACSQFRNVAIHAEWHALAWYTPTAAPAPGSSLPLMLEAVVTRSALQSCDGATPANTYTLRNHVTVRFAEAPLPRFDARWLYGDLHYHAQGTDNEGESAYHYRGVVRALGAMGVDFAFATEHASNSLQIMDAEADLCWDLACGEVNRDGLRDMSLGRFRAYNDALHLARGVNRTEAMMAAPGRAPQGYASHGVIPQVFLGGEVDAIPEAAAGSMREPLMPYGNGLTYDISRLVAGAHWSTVAVAYNLFEPVADGVLIRDVQGINRTDYGREHLIYLPRVGTDVNAFVASNTGAYGGASRRLADVHRGQEGVLTELARKGFAFLAHPLNAPSGGNGPDGPPWSESMIRKAWRDRAVLGMQFWNEPARLTTTMGHGDSFESGYGFDGSTIDEAANLADSERQGFATGTFALQPYFNREAREFERWSLDMERALHHGAYTWDRSLLWGLDTNLTSGLAWLPAGEPRRFFMAAGSDAHGDLNYRREGYFTGTTGVSDVALGKARNLVFAGAPTLPRDSNLPASSVGLPAERHSHDQVVRAVADGNFSVTNGPALRVVIDRNGNGSIDDADTPMGGVLERYGDATLPLLVEWRSTPEFGPVEEVQLYVGVRNDRAGIDGGSRVYAPPLHGTREPTILGDTTVSSYVSGGRTYAYMEDHYWRDPTGLLRHRPATASMAGVYAVRLPVAAFEAARASAPDRLFVRAFARTAAPEALTCASVTDIPARNHAIRTGRCMPSYAYSNPVWVISPAFDPARCPRAPRSLDRDGDQLPDACDACPSRNNDQFLCDPRGGDLGLP